MAEEGKQFHSHVLDYFSSLVKDIPELCNFFSHSKDTTDLLQHKINLCKEIKALSKISESDNSDKRQKATLFFTPFLREQWENDRLYPVLRKVLKDSKEKGSALYLDQLGDLLLFSTMIEAVHDQCLNTPSESWRTSPPPAYRSDQDVYDQWIFDQTGKDFGMGSIKPSATWSAGSSNIRIYIATVLNHIRLFFQRLRRVAFTIAPLATEHAEYQQGLSALERACTFFIFTNIIWVFFIPRLFINFSLIFKHSFMRSHMSQLEWELGLWARFKAQIVLRWQELANDIVWFGSGITTCFVLAGRLPVIGLWLGVAMQLYDVICSIITLYIDRQRYVTMMANFNNAQSGAAKVPVVGLWPGLVMEIYGAIDWVMDFFVEKKEMQPLCVEDNAALTAVLDALSERMAFDLDVLQFRCGVFIALATCVVFTMPYFAAISPVIPLVAAIVAVLITVINAMKMRQFENMRLNQYGRAQISPEECCAIRVSEPSAELIAILMVEKPSSEQLTKINLGLFKRGYIRIKNDQLDELYFVDKVGKTITNTKALHPDNPDLNKDILTNYDQTIYPDLQHENVVLSIKPKTITQKVSLLDADSLFRDALRRENESKQQQRGILSMFRMPSTSWPLARQPSVNIQVF